MKSFLYSLCPLNMFALQETPLDKPFYFQTSVEIVLFRLQKVLIIVFSNNKFQINGEIFGLPN